MADREPFRAPQIRRSTTTRASDRAAAAKQARRAAARGIDDDLIAQQTDRVILDRDLGRRDHPESELKPLDLVRRGRRRALVVRDERLVRVDRDNLEEVRSLVAAEEARWVTYLDDRLAVVPARRMAELPSTDHYAVPFGPVMKAAVGAEPASPIGAPPRTTDTATQHAAPFAIAIVDTGISASARRDGWLAGVHQTAANEDPRDALPPDSRLDLGAGHGTFIAGIIEQVKPRAEIRMYRGLDSDGVGSEESVASAMVLAAMEGAAVVCLSLGLQTLDDSPPVGLQVATEVINERFPDVVIVAAAGNFGDDHRPCWPAALPSITAVGGLDRDMQLATWSSRGPWVDCSTIGEAVHSTFVEGTERDDVDPDPVADSYPTDAWAVWSGTSFAAPQVAGAIAQVAISNALSAPDALAALLQAIPVEPDSGPKIAILPPIT